MASPPQTYPNPRSDDSWDSDAVEWLMTQPGVSAEFTRGALFECARRQPDRLARQPERVELAAGLCRRYGVQQLALVDPRVGKSIVRLRRTDADAPDYPAYDDMLAGRTRSMVEPSVAVVQDQAPWKLAPGDSIRRVDLHAALGGSRQGGISPSSRSSNVFVFSDAAAGEKHGYFDGWHDDGMFHYTGEGQRGDQRMRVGNAAILRHGATGRTLRLFHGARGAVRYAGEFEVADDEPFYLTDAPETDNGPIRQVIVFRLRPVDTVPDGSSTIDPLLKRRVERVPVEQQMTEHTWVAPSEGHEAERREQKLVLAYAKHLLGRNIQSTRLKIVPHGEHKPLFTDLYSADLNLLVEAKGTGERGSVRMAIGQLADYKRFVEPPPTCAVLLPQEPRPDLAALLAAEGIVAIWPRGHSYLDSCGGRYC